MKKSILLVLVFVLTLCLLAGCRNGSTTGTTPSGSAGDMIPDASNGAATDGDGIIGDDNQDDSMTGDGSQESGDQTPRSGMPIPDSVRY